MSYEFGSLAAQELCTVCRKIAAARAETDAATPISPPDREQAIHTSKYVDAFPEFTETQRSWDLTVTGESQCRPGAMNAARPAIAHPPPDWIRWFKASLPSSCCCFPPFSTLSSCRCFLRHRCQSAPLSLSGLEEWRGQTRWCEPPHRLTILAIVFLFLLKKSLKPKY